MAKAPNSKIHGRIFRGGFHVFNIPSPYGSMLLILETSRPICSSLVPKPEDHGRDKAQRKNKNEKRERWRGRMGAGKNKYNSSPFASESEVRLDRGQDPSCEAGFLSLGEEQTCPHLAAPAGQGPMQTRPPCHWLVSWTAQLRSQVGAPLVRFGEGLIWGKTPKEEAAEPGIC